MIAKFNTIVSSDEFDDFMINFTKSFLKNFYGTTEYFCVASVAKEATFEVIERARIFYEDIEENPTLILSILKHGTNSFDDQSDNSEFDETDWFDLINSHLRLFVTDLFSVTKLPIKFACKLNKGEYPNGDLISLKISKFNEKYNLKIMKFLYKYVDT